MNPHVSARWKVNGWYNLDWNYDFIYYVVIYNLNETTKNSDINQCGEKKLVSLRVIKILPVD